MSISQLQLEKQRLQVQLAAMAPGSLAYNQTLTQLRHLTTALNGAAQGIRGLNF